MKYRCHKTVDAFEIGRIEGHTLFSVDGNTSYEVDEQYINRHPLNLPGYFVQYEDGYMSWSPKETFEAGYSLLDKRRIIHLKLDESILQGQQDINAVMNEISEMFRAAVADRQGSIITTLPDLKSEVVTIETVAEIDSEDGPREFVALTVTKREPNVLKIGGTDVPVMNRYNGSTVIQIPNSMEFFDLLKGRDFDRVELIGLEQNELHAYLQTYLNTMRVEHEVTHGTDFPIDKHVPEITWFTTHVYPEGTAINMAGEHEIHLLNESSAVRLARGRSVNRIVLHGLTVDELNEELRVALENSTATYRRINEKEVPWEEE